MKKTIIISLSGLMMLLIALYIVTPTATLYRVLVGAERSLAGLELKRLTLPEFDIEYLRGGSGPPLVLLHGFGADKDSWNRLAGHLTPYFDVIAIDLPGFGNSSKDHQLDYSVSSQVARVKHITDALALSDFYLTGSSMGGYIAGNFAAQYPDKVKSLWLISPFGVENSATSEMFAATEQGQQPMVLPRSEAEFLALFDFLFVNPPFVPAPILDHLASNAQQKVTLNAKIFQQIHRMQQGKPNPEAPLDSVLSQYPDPVLITWGELDRVLHVSGAKGLQQAIPHAKVDVMTNVGHLPMMESPYATAQSFLAFTATPSPRDSKEPTG